ncbi:protein timeless homolog [Camellia sinensis]|uniref:protein timeless homolog n=1 Tax=Camellia sinensis TaxID=4442 RepID=UPI001036C5EB|nr:protein timeless homolog [Camellia sinensis]
MEGLSAICAGLGVIEEDDNGNRNSYTPGEYCLDNLKDLLRFLRRDDPQTREVFKQVCKWNIVGKDLIPIIEHCQDDRNLVLNSVKVLVFLTMPVEPTSNDIPQQIEYLWGLMSSITCSDIVPVIVSLLESPLENLEHEAFTEDDWKLVQLVLTLFRNILAIQDIPLHEKAGGSATQFLSLRDKFLELLFRENATDLILVLTQHIGGSCGYIRQDNLLLLETFHYIFIGQEPELIAKAYSKGLKVDGDAKTSINSLRSIMEEEQEKRKLTRLRNLGCYSQFTGTFTRLTMDGSKTLCKGNPCSASHDPLHNSHKVHRGPLKRVVWDYGRLPSTRDNTLELLHDFVNQLLSGGYNVLMESICEDVEKEHHTIQNSDVIIFFQVAQFITSFQYHKSVCLKSNMKADPFEASVNHHADSTLFEGNLCGPIAASMNESMFLLVISKWRYAYDSLKQTNEYKFVSAAGSLMKIMIRMLDLVLKVSPEDSKDPQTARILLYKLFYDQTDQGMTQFLLNQMKSFDTHKQAKSDLADLVETIHVVIRLIENLEARGTLRVSRKSRKKRAKKIMNDKSKIDQPVGDHVPLQNEVSNPGCEQSAHSSMLSEEKLMNPSSDVNGEETAEPFQVDKPETSELDTLNHESNLPGMKNTKSDVNCDGIDDSSSDEQLPVTNEVDFEASALVSALASNALIQNLCWLLKFYKTNSTSTNHYIICMLRRICDDLELSPMLYQLSLLNTFYIILAEQKSSPCKEYENIVLFLTSLVRRMLRKMKSQPLLFVEVLFWKTRKECHYINCESLLHEVGNLKRESAKWGSVSNDGEMGSTQGKGWVRRSIADAFGDDEADFVISHEMDKQKEEDPHEVLQRSKRSNGERKENITSISNDRIQRKENSDSEGHFEHVSQGVSNRRKSLVINEDLERQIKGLYEKYKNSRHCSRLIAEALDQDGKVSPVQVSNKLRQLGLRVLPKKRMLQAGASIQPREEGASGNELKESSVLKPLHTRKRVRAFSEDQETMIKDLFEQFKDQRRCSHMIANALDADGTFTAAQVSRKLKQLGLRVAQQKRPKAETHLKDEDVINFSAETAEHSDNETLLSLKKRSKNKKIERENKDMENQKIEGKVSHDSSEDEFPGSVSGDGHERPSGMEVDDDGTLNRAVNAEAQATSISSEKQVGTIDANNLQHQQLHDELEDQLSDLGDDATPVTSQHGAVLRRKLRMVIDPEDDE